jgi:serine/threonine protein kinase
MFAQAPTPEPSTHSSASALPIGTRLGEFEISRVLGAGGFGIVYLAVDHALQREVAIKEYMPASLAGRTETLHLSLHSQTDAATFALGLKSFVNEARLLARFDHPSLLKVLRFWEANGTAYMAMPVMRGSTWKDVRLALDGPPSEAWVLRMLLPLLGAIERLHAEGVYHRDISPDNIQIEANGNPVLLDFGAARHVISDKSLALTTILKPAYAPIEQYAEQGSVKQGPWTDLYSLGATLHYVLLARPPVPATVRAVHDDPSPLTTLALPGCSDRFLRTIDWMLAPRPGDRPRSVADLRAALDGHTEPPPRAAPQPAAAHSWDTTQMLPAAGLGAAAGALDFALPEPPHADPSSSPALGLPPDEEITRPSWLLLGSADPAQPASEAGARGYADAPLPAVVTLQFAPAWGEAALPPAAVLPAAASAVQAAPQVTLPPALVNGEQVRSVIVPQVDAPTAPPTAAQAAWVVPPVLANVAPTRAQRPWLPVAVFVGGLLAALVVVARFWQPAVAPSTAAATATTATTSAATANPTPPASAGALAAAAPVEVILPNTVRDPAAEAAAAASAEAASAAAATPAAAGVAKGAAKTAASTAANTSANTALRADAAKAASLARPASTGPASEATTSTYAPAPAAGPGAAANTVSSGAAYGTTAPTPTPKAAPAADPAPAATGPDSCTGKGGMAGFICMERQCSRAENASHPDCMNWHKNARRE